MKTFCCKILRLDVKDYNIKARYTVNGIFRGSVVKKKKKIPPAMQETWVQSLSWEAPWRSSWQPTPVFLPRKSHGQKAWWATVHGFAEGWTRLNNNSNTVK